MLTSLHNPIVKHLVKLRENKNYRQKKNSVLVSGTTLVQEIAQNIQPARIFITPSNPSFIDCQTIQVSDAVMQKITGMPSPEPIAAEFPLPKASNLQKMTSILALDAIRDPGNFGTLIRTALACGWSGLFCLPSCVDLFHEKVIRSSRGAVFRIPWQIGTWDELEWIRTKEHYVAYIADLMGTNVFTVQPPKKIILILSNESQGVSRYGALFGERISIPMKADMESLNVAVAGGILMYLLKKTHA